MSLLAKIYRKRDENLQNLIDKLKKIYVTSVYKFMIFINKKHFDIKSLNLVAIRLDKGFFD
ncbi:hypothetical protein G6W43_08415 [Campylobacter concisus]|uniref:hypothetical protein n=1 Tax=Campylobacter concisus TaxID=199 RepID=UPI0018842C45|nr:hypothetical protein [Campylobacter concisus]MBE9857257.1 hypothetical protein [Campylobacter concisus]